jgi:hypothetical protein
MLMLNSIKSFLICFLLSINYNVNAQQKNTSSLNSLDSKYGLSKYKFGTNVNEFLGQESFILSGSGDGIVFYEDNSLKSYLGYDVSQVLLGFWDDKLCYVEIIIDDVCFSKESDKYNRIKNKFEVGYSDINYSVVKYENQKTQSINGVEYEYFEEQVVFDGNKCNLVIDRMKNVKSNHEFLIRIWGQSKILKKQKLKSEL